MRSLEPRASATGGNMPSGRPVADVPGSPNPPVCESIQIHPSLDGLQNAAPRSREESMLNQIELFRNRIDAARQLAEKLKGHSFVRPVVLAIPRGGVVTGAVLARELGAELDVVLARELLAPFQ